MKLKQKIHWSVAAILIILSGCSPTNYLEGTVKEIYTNTPHLTKSSGAIFGNESVKLNNPYCCLVVDTNSGTYIVEIGDDSMGTSGPKTIYNLLVAIRIGTKIKFPVKKAATDKIELLDPDDIEILSNDYSNNHSKITR